MFLYVLIEGVAFHRTLGVATEFLSVGGNPQELTCSVGDELELESILTNNSDMTFHLIGLGGDPKAQIDGQYVSSKKRFLVGRGKRLIRTRFNCKTPGRYDIPAPNITLASRRDVYKKRIRFRQKTTLTARPTVSPARLASIDSSILDELTPDHNRRGTGTDLAGIRPSAVLEDMHRVDWKATARTGSLMAKEFYPEKQPAVMLLIDAARTMKTIRKGRSTFGELLTALPNLLASLKPATPIGLTLYNENSILVNIPIQAGGNQKNLIINSLLENSGSKIAKSKAPEGFGRPINDTTPAAWLTPQKTQETFDPFSKLFSRFFTSIWPRRRIALRGQGAYLAFIRLLRFPESSLIIAITDGKTNLRGLIEGARTAAVSGHRIILALIATFQKVQTSYFFPELQNVGIKMQECSPEELPSAIQTEIARMTRERIVLGNLEEVQGRKFAHL